MNLESIGKNLRAFRMGAQRQTAAGAGDNTEVTPSDGADIHPPGKRNDYPSGALVLAGRTTLTAAATLTLKTVKESESDDGSSWGSDTTLSAYSDTVILTGALTAEDWTYLIPLNLKGKKRFVRYKITMDLSAGSADLNDWSASLVCVDTESPASATVSA